MSFDIYRIFAYVCWIFVSTVSIFLLFATNHCFVHCIRSSAVKYANSRPFRGPSNIYLTLIPVRFALFAFRCHSVGERIQYMYQSRRLYRTFSSETRGSIWSCQLHVLPTKSKCHSFTFPHMVHGGGWTRCIPTCRSNQCDVHHHTFQLHIPGIERIMIINHMLYTAYSNHWLTSLHIVSVCNMLYLFICFLFPNSKNKLLNRFYIYIMK